jgi:hypothetical protein
LVENNLFGVEYELRSRREWHKKDNMKKNFATLAGLLLLAGCASQAPELSTYYDPVMGNRTDLLSGNLLDTPGQPRELVELNASRVWKNFKDAAYYLEVSYMARAEVGFLEIPPGEMLTIVADGKPLKFDGSGSMNMRKPYKKELVRENAIYPASKNALQQIASAQQVKVQIKGNKGLVQRDFAPENLERFRKFVAAYAQ